MSHNPVTVEGIISVEHLMSLLKHPFSSFPVLNSSGNIVGVISKNFIIKLIELKHFVDTSKLDMQKRNKPPKIFRRSTSGLDQRPPLQSMTESEPWFEEESLNENKPAQNEEGAQERKESQSRTESIFEPLRAEEEAFKELKNDDPPAPAF